MYYINIILFRVFNIFIFHMGNTPKSPICRVCRGFEYTTEVKVGENAKPVFSTKLTK